MPRSHRLTARGIGLIAISLLWIACRSAPPPAVDDGGVDGSPMSGDGPAIDAPGCSGLSRYACSNCIDDDGDGYIDSFDVECTSPWDIYENSFLLGFLHEDPDGPWHECFFDTNNGAGNDGCNVHACCILGARTAAECPIAPSQYDPSQCPPPIGTGTLSQQCIDVCSGFTQPGCDCFGCCTLCDPVTNACRDIALTPDLSPNCTSGSISDPAVCKSCRKVPSCGKPDCGGSTCIRCLGQTSEDLAPSCAGASACPAGTQRCANGEACPADTYCHGASGCCIGTYPDL